MKKLVISIALGIVAVAAYARCTTQTVTSPDGRMMTCTTCCDNWGNCNTTCI